MPKMKIFRSPKTRQELRTIYAAKADGLPYRLRRKKIPTAWEDIRRNRLRNWKAHRKRQWKKQSGLA